MHPIISIPCSTSKCLNSELWWTWWVLINGQATIGIIKIQLEAWLSLSSCQLANSDSARVETDNVTRYTYDDGMGRGKVSRLTLSGFHFWRLLEPHEFFSWVGAWRGAAWNGERPDGHLESEVQLPAYIFHHTTFCQGHKPLTHVWRTLRVCVCKRDSIVCITWSQLIINLRTLVLH